MFSSMICCLALCCILSNHVPARSTNNYAKLGHRKRALPISLEGFCPRCKNRLTSPPAGKKAQSVGIYQLSCEHLYHYECIYKLGHLMPAETICVEEGCGRRLHAEEMMTVSIKPKLVRKAREFARGKPKETPEQIIAIANDFQRHRELRVEDSHTVVAALKIPLLPK